MIHHFQLVFFQGLGVGITHFSCTLVVPHYFEKYRPIALGISFCGLPVGNMVFPWINTQLNEFYGWRGAVIILSGKM